MWAFCLRTIRALPCLCLQVDFEELYAGKRTTLLSIVVLSVRVLCHLLTCVRHIAFHARRTRRSTAGFPRRRCDGHWRIGNGS